jgi:hypothetical protein
VVKGSPLLALLRRIRRRVRFFAALEGAIAGGAVAGLVLAVGIAIVRRRGGVPGSEAAARAILLGLTGVAAGAVVRAGRHIPLERCARIADAALDGQERVLSALTLEREAPPPLVAALVADAIRSAARLAPAGYVPARRPSGLAALGLAALALAGAVLFPAPSRAARPPRPMASVARRSPLPPGALDVEREEARAALAEVARHGDERLAALAAELDRMLRDLSKGTLADGETLEALRALEARAEEAARQAERDGRAAAAAAHALGETPETRAAGRALAASDEGASERASAALGASAEARPAETGRALAAAARGVAASSSEAGATEPEAGPRRLARNDPAAGQRGDPSPTPTERSEGRSLEQLRRDLDRAADACRDGDPSCRARAERSAQDLARLGRQGAAASALQRLARTTGQLRARVARGELHDNDTLAARSFGRAARGQSPESGEDGDRLGKDERSGPTAEGKNAAAESASSAGDEGAGSQADTESGAAAGAEAAALSQGDRAGASEGAGDGIGRQPGDAPLGGQDDIPAARGYETEARLAGGAGPSRAAVIGAAAGRGFVAPGYARVFTDYAAAVEDALGITAVPEGKRFVVRRYFDLIRPRSPR